MLYKLFTVYVYFQSLLCGCGPDRRSGGFERPDFKYKLQREARLPEQVQESSGLALAPDSTFWTHGDGGTPATLFRFTGAGDLQETLPLPLRNTDWEDLTESPEHLFIGDFGNNENKRQDLQIHLLRKPGYTVAGTIHFRFEDQQEYPPAASALHYDLEAFFYHQDSLYLFTKSRGRSKQLKLYTLPAVPGTHVAQLRQQMPVHAMLTAAAISPSGRQFALLGYGRLYLFSATNGLLHLNGRHYCLPLPKTGQAEAVVYASENELLLTNENGKVFTLRLKR